MHRQAHALRETVRADADAARQRLEDAARDRWDAVRAETESWFEQL